MKLIRRSRTMVVAVALAGLLAACSSTGSSSGSPTSGSTAATGPSGSLPAGATAHVDPAMSATKTPCPTASSCYVSGNVSTSAGGVPGLFQGAIDGTDAYLAYQNSLGGLNGRKFKLIADDDRLSCATNKADTQALVGKVLAFTGSFSLNDQCGGQVLAQHPTVPDVSVTLDATTQALPNVFSVQPAAPGMATGPLLYFKKKFPKAITKVGTLVTSFGSAPAQWAGEQAAMEHLGYKVIYDKQFSVSTTDFSTYVVQMEQAGVQMVVLIAINDSYAAKLLADMSAQGFHPTVVWGGASIYSGTSPTSSTLVKDAGGPAVADGVYLEQSEALYLGQDAKQVPDVATFVHWVHGLYPGSNIDLFTLYGWASAELYVDALKKAGSNPTQADLLASLKKITSFDAGGMLAPADPAQKKPATCYVLAQVRNGAFQRVDMPANSVYRCDGSYFHASGT